MILLKEKEIEYRKELTQKLLSKNNLCFLRRKEKFHLGHMELEMHFTGTSGNAQWSSGLVSLRVRFTAEGMGCN